MMKSLALAVWLTTVFALYAEEPNEKASRYHKLLLRKPENTMVFNRFIDAWLDSGDSEGLKTWLSHRAEEGSTADWHILAGFHENRGEDAQALEAFGQAVKLEPANAALRLARAKLQAKLLDFETALKDLEAAAKEDDLEVEAAKLRGIYLVRAGRIEEAVKAWKEVLDRFPDDEELREDLIEVQVAEGLYEDALSGATDLVAMTKDPYKKALRQLRLGDIQLLAKKREEGLQTYEKIISSTGEGSWLEREVLAQINRVFAREDDATGLRDFYQKLRENHPRRVSIRKALAGQMALTGEIDEAIALFREVLKVTPGDRGNREEFISFLEKNERWQLARDELAELIKQQGDDPLLWERMASLEEKRGDQEGIRKALAKVRALRGESPEGLISVATLYAGAGLSDEAEKLLREGQKVFPESDEMRNALASQLVENQKIEEAVMIWRELAAVADREGLLRVVRSLSSRDQVEVAFDLLRSRLPDFAEDRLVLTQLCALALTEKQSKSVIPAALTLVRQAEAPTDLETGIKTALQVLRRADGFDQILANLEGLPERTTQENCLLAEIHSERGDTIRAKQILDQSPGNKNDLLAKFYRVQFFENRGTLDQAIAQLREIVATPEGRKTVHQRRLVKLLERNGDLEEALTAVDQWKQMAPGDQAAWTRRAALLRRQGKLDEAVTELRRQIGKFGPEEESRVRLADTLRAANQNRAAERIYLQLYEEAGQLASRIKWAGELADLAQQEGRVSELLAEFERRKKENPKAVAPVLAIAEIYRAAEDYEKRRTALLEASRRRPDDLELLFQIARVEERAGEFGRAEGLFQDAMKRDSGEKAKRELAHFYLKNNEYEKGFRLLKQIPGEGNDPRRIEQLANSLLAKKEWDLVVRYLSDYLPEHPDDWRLSYLSGIALMMEGQTEKARVAFQKIRAAEAKIPNLASGQNLTPGIPPLDPASADYRKRLRDLGLTYRGWYQLKAASEIFDRDYRSLVDSSSYSYRQMNRATLPGSVEEVRILAHLWLFKLTSEFTNEEDAIKTLLAYKLPGIERLDLFMLGRLKRLQDQAGKFQEDFEKNPGDLRTFYNWIDHLPAALPAALPEDLPDPSIVKTALEALAKKDPLVAANILGNLFSRGVLTGEEPYRMALDLLALLPAGKDRGAILSSLASIANHLTESEGEIARLRNQLQDSLFEQASAFQDQDDKKETLTHLNRLVDLAIHASRGKEAVTLLNRVHELVETNPATAAQQPRGIHAPRRLNQRTPKYPSFSPESIPGISFLIASEFRKRNDVSKSPDQELNEQEKIAARLLAGIRQNQEKTQSRKEETLEVFRGHLEGLKSERLKILIAHRLGDSAPLVAYFSKLDVESRQIDLRLAAGYFWQQNEKTKSHEFLIKLSQLPLEKTQRVEIDSLLAHTGAELLDEEKEKFDPEPARRAALRTAHTNRALRGLDQVFKRLGLEKEWQRLSSRPGPVAGNPNSSSSYRTLRNVAGIPDLVTQGRRTEAARQAVRQLRSLTWGRRNYEQDQFFSMMRNLGLAEEVLRRTMPSDTASPKRLLAIARIAEALGQEEEARRLYELVVKARAGQFEARVSYYLSLSDGEQEDFDLMGEGKIEGDFEVISARMVELWDGDRRNFEKIMGMTQFAAQLLEKLPPEFEKPRNLSWVNYSVINSTCSTYFDSGSIPSLLTSNQDQNQKVDAEKVAQRNSAAEKLFRAMLRHPQTALQGFILLEKARKNLALEDQELQEFALQAARTHLLSRNTGRNDPDRLWRLTRPNGSSSSRSVGNPVLPQDYLSEHRTIKELFSPDFLKQLKEINRTEADTWLAAREIVDSEPDQALAALKEYFAKRTTQLGLSPALYLGSGSPLHQISLRLFQLQAPAGAATDYLEEKIFNSLATQSVGTTVRKKFLQEWMNWKLAIAPDSLDGFFTSLTAAHLGPQENWQLLGHLPRTEWPKEIESRVGSFDKDFSALASQPQCIGPMLDFLERNKIAFSTDLLYLAITTTFTSTIDKSFEQRSDFLKASSICQTDRMSPARLYWILHSKGRSMIKSKKEAGEFTKHPWAAPVAKKAFKTNWLSSPEKQKTIAQGLEQNLDHLTVLLDEYQPKIHPVLTNLLGDPALHQETPGIQKLLIEGERANLEKIVKQARHWLDHEITIDRQDYEGRQWWIRVKEIMSVEPELAAQVASKVLMTMMADPSLNRGTSSYNGFANPNMYEWAGELFEGIVGHNSNQIEIIPRTKFINTFYQSEVGEHLPSPGSFTRRYLYYLGNSISTEAGKLKRDPESKLPAEAHYFLKLAAELSEDEQLTFLAVHLSGMRERDQWYQSRAPELAKWANENLREKSPILADGLIVLLRSKQAYLQEPDENTKASEKEARTALARLLKASKKFSPLTDELPLLVTQDYRHAPLLATPEVWQWLISHLGKLNNGNRTLNRSVVFQYLPHLLRGKFPGREKLEAPLYEALKKNLLTPPTLAAYLARSSPPWIADYLVLALRLNDLETTNTILAKGANYLRGNLVLMQRLFDEGFPEFAPRLTALPTGFYQNENLADFSREMEKFLPKLLEAIPNPEKYRVEVMMSARPDVTTEGKTPGVPRKARLLKLAEKYQSGTLPHNEVRWQILSTLVFEPAVAAKLRDDLIKETHDHDLLLAVGLQSVGNKNRSAQALLTLHNAYLDLCLTEKKFQPVVDAIKKLALGPATNENGYASRQAAAISANLAKSLYQKFHQDPKSANEVVDLIQPLIPAFDFIAAENLGSCSELTWLGILAANQSGTNAGWWQAWKESGTNYHQKLVRQKNYHSIQQLMQPLAPGAEELEKLKKKYLGQLLRDPGFCERFVPRYHDLSSLMDGGLISQAGLIQVIDDLPADHPRKAEFLMEKAGILAWRKNKFEEARKAYDSAQAFALEKNQPGIAHLCDALYARALSQKDRSSESWEFAQKVNPDLLPEAERTWFVKESVNWKNEASKQSEASPKPDPQPAK